jgi:phosphoserine phosphatase
MQKDPQVMLRQAESPPTLASVRAVIFDMDGVLFEGRNFWLDLHRCFGGDAGEAQRLLDRYVESDYDTLAEKIVGELWRGKPADPYFELVARRKYQPGAKETVASLRSKGIRTAIVTAGPDLLAERAQKDLGIDLVRANGVAILHGHLTGESKIAVRDSEKGAVGLEVLGELGVGPDAAASVGDGDADAYLARLVGTSIAYDTSSERLLGAAQHCLRYGELQRVVEILGEEPHA